jgi:hypothetical protein
VVDASEPDPKELELAHRQYVEARADATKERMVRLDQALGELRRGASERLREMDLPMGRLDNSMAIDGVLFLDRADGRPEEG